MARTYDKCTVTYSNNIFLSNSNNNNDEKDMQGSDNNNDNNNKDGNSSKIVFDEANHGHLFHPIGRLFYSPKRNMLMTDHPSYVREEIESFYCPQCLENYPSSEASTYKSRCPRVECLKCPYCTTVLTTIVSHLNGYEGPQTYLSCGYCFWDSVHINLVAKTGAELFNKIMEIEDTMDPVCLVTSRVHALQEKNKIIDRKIVLRDRLKQRSTTSMKTNLLLQLARLEYGKKKDSYTTWNWQDATEYEKKKHQEETKRKNELNNNISQQIQNYIEEGRLLVGRQKSSKMNRQNSSNATNIVEESSNESTNNNSNNNANAMMDPPDLMYYNGDTLLRNTISLETRLNQPGLLTANREDLLPQRQPLRTKRTIRCRKTFDSGSPGILLKPHINPLMGDTSMRTNIGNWFKKSSLAISFYPRFTIESCTSTDLLLYIINPYDEPVHVELSNVDRINNSNYNSNNTKQKVKRIVNFPPNGFGIREYDELAEQDEEWLHEDEDGGHKKIDTTNDETNNIVKRELNRVLLHLKWESEEGVEDCDSDANDFIAVFQVSMKRLNESVQSEKINYLVKLNMFLGNSF